MRYIILLFLSALLSFRSLWAQSSRYDRTERQKINVNADWKFVFGAPEMNYNKVNFNSDEATEVSIPHGLRLTSFRMDSTKDNRYQKNYLRDIGWYQKKMVINAKAHQKVFLEFEAVHNVTDLWVNGQHVGQHSLGGYTPFHFDITDFVNRGTENTITIKADNSFDPSISPDPDASDFVKFAGIYRDVYLVVTDPVHVGFNWEDINAGVHITTPAVNKRSGTVTIKTNVKNEWDKAQKVTVETRVVNAEGIVLKKLSNEKTIPAKSNTSFHQTTGIDRDFHLWSPDSPYLYRAISTIYVENKAVDFVENSFGFRWFELVAGQGLLLNGEPLFLIGVNRHQHFPIIGDAVPNSLQIQEAKMYKEAGMNAVRTSHYTQDDAFIEACDKLGLIVYEEAPTWIDWGDKLWWQKLEMVTRRMIRNHKNHPSILFWGAGINHRGPVPQMQYAVKEEDPFRLTASASSAWNGVKNAGITDIYATMDYRWTSMPDGDFAMSMEHGCHPNSEANQFHISRYKERKNNIGCFAWLGADYNRLGPDNEPNKEKMSDYAVLTAFRLPKPVYYWYQSELTPAPMVHIGDHRASNNGKVRVFSNAQVVELYQDGQLMATQTADNSEQKNNLNHPSFTFFHDWKAGQLEAVAYKNGVVVARDQRTKAQKPYKIRLEKTDDVGFGDGDMQLVHAYIEDKWGNLCSDYTERINFKLTGDGKLIDDPKALTNPAEVFDGIASIYVAATAGDSKFKVEAFRKGLKSGHITVNTKNIDANVIENEYRPVYDYPRIMVDIGGKKQYVQHEFEAWTESKSFKLKGFNEAVASLDATKIDWSGGASMLGNLSFMGADAAYATKGKLSLTLSSLPAGTYKLETYHHVRLQKFKLPKIIHCDIQDERGLSQRISDDHGVFYMKHDDAQERKPLFMVNYIVSNGKDPIVLDFYNENIEQSIWLNGLILEQVNAVDQPNL
ncbi:hypothetical protein PEPS_45790 (plasmid) [Persicobacter psychrovividus]|uniref:Beta-galactosidase n=2 Tax=Persicobacter psychrovividus TaxID=387638 RepID=A0ABM7VMQ3_9BACT|nr:hypothetical protein PEPS_45790 [Persicobacter psychrovividus]